MYKKGAGNDKQGKDVGNRTLCPYRNFSQAIIYDINGSADSMYTADNICRMIEFLIDNIFVQFGGRLFVR